MTGDEIEEDAEDELSNVQLMSKELNSLCRKSLEIIYGHIFIYENPK